MNLWDESFIKIMDKTKTIEMRLCDEKTIDNICW